MDEKVYYLEETIDNPFPGGDIPIPLLQGANPAGTYTPTVSKEKGFPTRKIATELIGQALNTRSRKILGAFEFTPSGSIQIGDFQEGISGDLRLTPNGLTARNISGLNTFAIDGDTGDAVFAGQIQSGAIITGLLQVGGDNIIIDGDGERITMIDSSGDTRVLIGDDGT